MTDQPKTREGDVVRQGITKTLTFKLTREDIAEKGILTAELSQEIGELEAEAKQAKKIADGKIALKTIELENALKVIREREEDRVVNCTLIKDYDQLIVQYEYDGKIMEERAMTMEERQLDLDEQRKKRDSKKSQESEKMTDSQTELRQVIRDETNKNTKKDLVV